MKIAQDNNITIYYDIPFDETIEDRNDLGEHATSWPVTYILYNKSKSCAYVGETTTFKSRMSHHLEDDTKKIFNKVLFIDYKKATKSTVLLLEAFLIRAMKVSGEYFNLVQNVQENSNKHDYYQKEKDEKIEEKVWDLLKTKIKIVINNYRTLIEKNEYKYSPFIALNESQLEVLNRVIEELITKDKNKIVIRGASGTGKSALALQLFKTITDYTNSEGKVTEDMIGMDLEKIKKINDIFGNKNHKYTIAYIAPMKNFCKIIRSSIKKVPGLRKKDLLQNKNYLYKEEVEINRVYSGNDLLKLMPIIKENSPLFDLVIVDEAHCLSRYKSLTNGTAYNNFWKMNKKLNLPSNKNENDGNQLDWIEKISKNQIYFYDENQRIRPTDIPNEYFEKVFKKKTYEEKLTIQERCLGGENYIQYIKDIVYNKKPKKQRIENYEFVLFDHLKDMKEAIDKKSEEGISLLSSGIDFNESSSTDGVDYIWNQQDENWINKKKTKDEVGIVFVLRGLETDYLGVIIGEEFDYDKEKDQIIVNKDLYKDSKGKENLNEEELIPYIQNIYYILLTRGLKGTYVYAKNKGMKEYLEKYINKKEI